MQNPKLLKYIGDFYKEFVLQGKPLAIAVCPLKALLSEDKEAADEAKLRLGELNKLDASTGGNLQKRCYVSHIHRTALQEALNG